MQTCIQNLADRSLFLHFHPQFTVWAMIRIKRFIFVLIRRNNLQTVVIYIVNTN